jgi:hypothetical protein
MGTFLRLNKERLCVEGRTMKQMSKFVEARISVAFSYGQYF